MNELNAYIESGILELYVLGDVTPAEKQQVEEMMRLHPEIKAEVLAIEQSIEDFAKQAAIEPPDYMRGRIENSLLTNLGDDRIFRTKIPDEVIDEEDDDDEDDKIVEMPRRQINYYQYGFAASVVLLIISCIALFYTRKQLENSNLQLAVLAAQNQQIAKTASYKDQQIAQRDTQIKQSNSQLADAVNKNQATISKPDNFKSQHLVIFKDTSYRLVRLKPVPSAKIQSTKYAGGVEPKQEEGNY